MGYREVSVVEVREVLRRWVLGEGYVRSTATRRWTARRSGVMSRRRKRRGWWRAGM